VGQLSGIDRWTRIDDRLDDIYAEVRAIRGAVAGVDAVPEPASGAPVVYEIAGYLPMSVVPVCTWIAPWKQRSLPDRHSGYTIHIIRVGILSAYLTSADAGKVGIRIRLNRQTIMPRHHRASGLKPEEQWVRPHPSGVLVWHPVDADVTAGDELYLEAVKTDATVGGVVYIYIQYTVREGI